MNVIKRSGKEVQFDLSKIRLAISKANREDGELTEADINEVTNIVLAKVGKLTRAVSVDEIQNTIEDTLMKKKFYNTARLYIKFRYQKELNSKQNTTDAKILSIINLDNEEVKQENSNKNPILVPTQRDYIAGEVSKDLTRRYMLPKDISKAHDEGIMHYHDTDYSAQPIHNCDLWNLEDMLQNSTVINTIRIDPPKSFMTACTVATQIMAIVASSQYGGQTMTLSHLAPFVDVSRQKIIEEVKSELDGIEYSEEQFNKIVDSRLKKEIKDGVQTIQYQILTLNSTNGQTPFVTLEMYLNRSKSEQEKKDLALIIEEVLRQRIKGIKNEQGVWVTPTFPKLVYVLEPDNIEPDGEYYYLTELAAKCTAKRMVPDYVSEKVMKTIKVDKNGKGHCFAPMGCRSFLNVWDENPDKYFGRFNKGVVTINLVDVACSSKKNMAKFWSIFDERLELCHRALLCRYERLKGTPSDVAPILWQHGALARLQPGETIDRLLVGGYSSISLGYAGLWEMVYYMTGKKLIEPEGEEFGLRVMEHMNAKCDEWNAQLNLGFGIYGTPLESTTYKFAKKLQERFGIIPGVTDKSYITNSYHVHVTENIDAFSKLKFESKFQRLSTGGAISYVEVPNMQNNIPAVLSVIKFIYNNIMYAELNTKSDYCMNCGYSGEIKIVSDNNGKLIWECPNCMNHDQTKMSVVRRTCGYLGSNYFNQGRTQEIKERVLHL